MEKKPTSAVTIGLLISMVLIVFALVLYFTKLYTEQWGQYLSMVILAGAIIWGIINHGKETGYQAGFGGLFGFGFKITAVVTCLIIAYTFLQGYLFPDIKEAYLEKIRTDAMKTPNIDASQVEQSIQGIEKYWNVIIILGLLFWYLICGAIASLIGAAVTKKRPPFENSFNQ